MRVWVIHSIFVRETSDFPLVSLDPCSIHHSVYFGCDYFPCFDAGWPSLTFLSLRLLPSLFYSSVSLHLTSSNFFLFSSSLMFDLSSASTLYSCLSDMFIPLSSLLVWGPLGPGLMTFSTHCISCMRGMWIISSGSLSLVSLHFFHPITLAYVTSRVWRPPWGHYFTLCLIAHTWAILEISWRLFLGAWWMGSWGDDLHWDIPLLSAMDFQRWCDLHWGITHSPMIVSFEMMFCIEV